MNQRDFGVGLVFGSDAMGMDSLREATRRFIPDDLPPGKGTWSEISIAADSGDALERWLERFVKRYGDRERLVAYRDLRGTPNQLAGQVTKALAFCRRQSRRRAQWLRVVLALDPYHTWRWLRLPVEERQGLENQVDATVSLRRWNLVGVRQRLMQHRPEILSSDDACRAVLGATGGWRFLLDEFIKHCGKETDRHPHAEQFLQLLQDKDNPLHKQFRERVGKFRSPELQLTFAAVCQEGTVPMELFRPDLLPGCGALADHDCSAAAEYLERLGLVDRSGNDLIVEPIAKLVLEANGHPPA